LTYGTVASPEVTSPVTTRTDAELESAIVDALRLGLADVARTLAEQLRHRQGASEGNVVPRRGKRKGSAR